MKIQYCFLVAVLVSMACQPAHEATSSNQPNILFAFADDMGKYASCYAAVDGPTSVNKYLQTPNIDRLASQGMLFKHAFVNAPSCTPCRSSLLSGQHFYRTGMGAILQGAIWDENIQTFPLLLQKAGYHIGYTYKVWSPGQPRDAGFGGQTNRYQRDAKFNRFSQNVTESMKNDGISLDSAKQRLYDEVADNFLDFFVGENRRGTILLLVGSYQRPS